MFIDINTLIAKIETIVNRAHDFRKAYFFTPPSSAYARRQYERANSCPVTEWEEGGHTYTAAFSVSCSCSYVYARGVYTRDGHNTTLTAIKNSLERLKKAQACNIAA